MRSIIIIIIIIITHGTHTCPNQCMKKETLQCYGIKQYTDREVTANRPDIITKNKKEKTCTPIDVAIPADRNVVQKEAEKKLKYKSLSIEIERMWSLKCTIKPVIIVATGIVTRSLKKNLQAIPGTHPIDSLQKTAILGTSHILRKALQCETGNRSDGVHRWFKKQTGKKGPVTRDIMIIIIIVTSLGKLLLPFSGRETNFFSIPKNKAAGASETAVPSRFTAQCHKSTKQPI